MSYDPNMDNTVERMIDYLKSRIASKEQEIRDAKAMIVGWQDSLSALKTIQDDERRRLGLDGRVKP